MTFINIVSHYNVCTAPVRLLNIWKTLASGIYLENTLNCNGHIFKHYVDTFLRKFLRNNFETWH